MIGREVRGIARMSIWTRGAGWATFTLTWAVTAFTTRPAITGITSRATVAIRAWATWARTTRTRASGPWTTWAARASRLVAIRFARAARAIRIAMTGRTGIHALRNEPGAHRSGIVTTLLAWTQLLALGTRSLWLERFLRLLGSRFTADGQAAMLAWRAAAAAVFAHVVKPAQFATFIGWAVPADIPRASLATNMHGRLACLALAKHRHQGQRGWRAFLKPNRPAQAIDLGLRQFLGLAAQQRLRQAHITVTNTLQAADLAAL